MDWKITIATKPCFKLWHPIQICSVTAVWGKFITHINKGILQYEDIIINGIIYHTKWVILEEDAMKHTYVAG
jgi:hypothetical protein